MLMEFPLSVFHLFCFEVGLLIIFIRLQEVFFWAKSSALVLFVFSVSIRDSQSSHTCFHLQLVVLLLNSGVVL